MAIASPVELRRKKAEREAEFHRIFEDGSKDGADFSDDQLAKMQEISDECEEGGTWDKRIRAAEQYALIDKVKSREKDSIGRLASPLPHEDAGNTKKEKHQYSMLKAIREACGFGHGPGLSGLEDEVNKELRKRRAEMGLPAARGIMVPNNLPVDAHSYNRWAKAAGVEEYAFGLDTTAGAGSIPTILDTNMIDILRARMVTVAMGAQVMENMQGLFAIPRQSQAATFYWVTQGANVTQSNQTIDQVPFSPHTGGAQTSYTRQFVEQTNQSAEAFVRGDQAAVIARGIETAGLNGSGSGGQPLGLMQNSLIPTVSSGTNGGAPTWANIVQLESTVAEANADMGSLGYVTDASMRGTLKTTAKIGSTFPIYLWDVASATPLNGYKVGVTNLLPQALTHGSGTNLHALIYGNWNDMIYAFWSGMDVVVDPYTSAASGSIIVTTLQDCDVNVRHPESFAKMTDLITTQ